MNKVVEINMSVVYCVVQSSFHAQIPCPGSDPLLLTLELKGISLIHLLNYESGSHQSDLQGKPTCMFARTS